MSTDFDLLGTGAAKNVAIDRALMGQKAKNDPIGEVWTSPINHEKDDWEPVIVKVNPIMCTRLGFSDSEMKRMTVTDLMTRDETIALHQKKYFKEAFMGGIPIVMRSHGHGFQMKCKDGSYKKVALAVVFAEERPELEGGRMIPRSQKENYTFAILRVIFLEDFSDIIENQKY